MKSFILSSSISSVNFFSEKSWKDFQSKRLLSDASFGNSVILGSSSIETNMSIACSDYYRSFSSDPNAILMLLRLEGCSSSSSEK
jgi:hypothetical protein